MNQKFVNILKNIEKQIQTFLPESSDPIWQENTFGILPEGISSVHFEPLLQPTRELVDLGGKRWRPLLTVLTCLASSDNIESEKLAYSLAPLVEFVHTASLIHDDIEDSSEERRGKPSAYLTYGEDVAINAGSWLYFMAGKCIDNSSCPDSIKLELYRIYTEELRRLHLGQAMDIAWHRNPEIIPSEAEYTVMVKNKTGTLASLSAKIGTISSGCSRDIADKAGIIAAEIGKGFQIIDDVINLTIGNSGKNRGDDIVEGKKSLPVIYFMENASENEKNKLLEYFNTSSKDGISSPCVEKACNMLNQSGAVERARQEGIRCIKEGCLQFKKLYNNNDVTDLIEELFTSMIPKDL